jgi:hypothetical protein
MRAHEFNDQVTRVLGPVLADAGFKRVGSDFVRERNEAQLVLLRFGGSKFASFCQFTRFMLCFRHVFLRDMTEVVPASHPKSRGAYPFKIRPSDLGDPSVPQWSYRFELNPEGYDEIEYGQLADGASILRRMGALVATKGVEWADGFTPDRARQWLEGHGSDAWCERLWLEDYKGRTSRLTG